MGIVFRIIVGIFLFILAMCLVSIHEEEKRAKAPKPKHFHPPTEFDYVSDLIYALASLDTSADGHIYIDAEPGGAITLRATLPGMAGVLGHHYPQARRYFFTEHGQDDTIVMRFHEPDCFLYRCPSVPFAQDVQESAPNAVVDFHRLYPNGRVGAAIRFNRITPEEAQAHTERFIRLYDIFHQA